MPRGGPSSASYCAVAVGIAEGCLETYYKYTRPRKSRGTAVGAAGRRADRRGTAAAEIEAAVRMYQGALREAMGVLERKEPFTKHRQVHGKRNMAYAAQLSIQAVQTLFNDAGGRVLYRRPGDAAQIPRRPCRGGPPLAELARRGGELRRACAGRGWQWG